MILAALILATTLASAFGVGLLAKARGMDPSRDSKTMNEVVGLLCFVIAVGTGLAAVLAWRFGL